MRPYFCMSLIDKIVELVVVTIILIGSNLTWLANPNKKYDNSYYRN